MVNRLIDALPRSERGPIMARCEPVELAFGAVLCEPDEPFRHVYFPLTGFISLVVSVAGHRPLEMGLIGSEGMLGVTMVLGVGSAPLRAVVQGAGSALRMTAAQFRQAASVSPILLRGLNRYLYVLMAQLAQTTACTRFHEVEARLARWLLMTHDRAHADHFHLTHQFLADMLGVRRSGVTVAAGALQARNLIGYARGEIRILDRSGLEAVSCECYAAVVDDYRRLLN
ncbi:MAG: Crp/Fnr family transcriptional regulator [Stagnimonas sp.]|nr:Crp/Fnr family transcriptional regulator [Stagnimonas sp.]